MHVYSSTQHPGEVQHMVAHALGVPAHDVVVECRRMGGGFGGKETQPALFACVAALLARKTGRAVKLRARPRRRHALDRQAPRISSPTTTSASTTTAASSALDFTLASRCGYSADLSGPVNDRAMFHGDNCYFLENVAHHVVSLQDATPCPTPRSAASAARRACSRIEHVIDDIARHLGRDPLDVRTRQPLRHDRRATSRTTA